MNLIKKGGTSEIFLLSSGDKVKKVLLKGNSSKKMKKEIFFLQKLANKRGVVDILDHDNFKEKYIIMPKLEKNLKEKLEEGSLCSFDKVDIFLKILYSVKQIHESKVVHCDLKPENIMLNAGGDIIIIDFGMSCNFWEEKKQKGNFDFHAPEQKKEAKDKVMEGATDIYSLGLILNYMFTNSVPCGKKYLNISDVEEDFELLDFIVSCAIKNKRKDRININVFIDMIEDFIAIKKDLKNKNIDILLDFNYEKGKKNKAKRGNKEFYLKRVAPYSSDFILIMSTKTKDINYANGLKIYNRISVGHIDSLILNKKIYFYIYTFGLNKKKILNFFDEDGNQIMEISDNYFGNNFPELYRGGKGRIYLKIRSCLPPAGGEIYNIIYVLYKEKFFCVLSENCFYK